MSDKLVKNDRYCFAERRKICILLIITYVSFPTSYNTLFGSFWPNALQMHITVIQKDKRIVDSLTSTNRYLSNLQSLLYSA